MDKLNILCVKDGDFIYVYEISIGKAETLIDNVNERFKSVHREIINKTFHKTRESVLKMTPYNSGVFENSRDIILSEEICWKEKVEQEFECISKLAFELKQIFDQNSKLINLTELYKILGNIKYLTFDVTLIPINQSCSRENFLRCIEEEKNRLNTKTLLNPVEYKMTKKEFASIISKFSSLIKIKPLCEVPIECIVSEELEIMKRFAIRNQIILDEVEFSSLKDKLSLNNEHDYETLRRLLLSLKEYYDLDGVKRLKENQPNKESFLGKVLVRKRVNKVIKKLQ